MNQELKNFIIENGNIVEVSANNPFLLTEDNIWIVETGKIDVFAVRTEDNEPVGKRNHVLRIEKEEAILGIDGDSIALMAAGFPGTKVIQISKEILEELNKNHDYDQPITNWLDNWITKLSYSIVKDLSPKVFQSPDLDIETAIAPKSTIRPYKDVMWIKYLQGASKFIDKDELIINPEAEFFPISKYTWLETTENSKLFCVNTLSFVNQDDSWGGLTKFNEFALRIIEENIIAREEFEQELIEKKMELEEHTAIKSVQQLSSLLSENDASVFAEIDLGDPVLAACQLVGNAMGVKIIAPPTSNGGTVKKSRLDDIARVSRIRTRQVMLRGDWWQKDNGPLLGHIEDTKQPVALLQTSTTNYEMVDPVSGERRLVDSEIASKLSPFAFKFYRSFPDKSLTMIDIIKFGVTGCEKDLWMVALMGIIGGLLTLLTPLLTKQFFDRAIPEADQMMLFYLTMALVAAAFSVALFNITRAIGMLRLESKMNTSIQGALWDRLLNLPIPFFRKYSSGDLGVRAMGINTIREIISGVVATTVIGSLFSIFNLFLLFYYNQKLAFWGIGLAAVGIIFTSALSYTGLRYQRNLMELEGKISGMVLQFISGISKLRVAGAETHAFAAWTKEFSRKKKNAFKAGVLMNRQEVFNATFPVLASIVIFAATVKIMEKAVLDGEELMTLGSFLAFNTAFTTFLMAALQMSLALVSALNIIPIYERVRPILEEIPEIDLAKADPGELKGEIEMNHVDFRYNSDGPLILKDISLHIKPGEFVAFVGPSGSGKSTLMRLLLGFENAEAGSIYFDGQNLADIDIREVRRQIGVVLQISRLMSADVFTNIVGSSSSLTLDDAWEAARMAGFDKDVEEMPMKMHTMVSEGGSTLSGGQRQRLLIARALARKPRIIFFDEATSALDNQTQAAVSKSLENIQATRIAIAHRLSTILNADRIYVIHNGKIVETGNYEELMELNGHFAELARRQLA